MPIDAFMASEEFQNLCHVDLILSSLSSLGQKQVIDIAMVTGDDFHEISECDSAIASFRVVWHKACQYKDGWASLSAKRVAETVCESQHSPFETAMASYSMSDHSPNSVRVVQKKRVKQTVRRGLASFTRCVS